MAIQPLSTRLIGGLAGAMLAGASLLAMPAPSAIAADDVDCDNAASQMEMDVCASDAFKAADRTLNATYRKLMAELDADGQGYLRDAQRAWVSFRDKECVSRTGGGPDREGSIWPMIYTDCQTELTNERIKALEAQVACPGGDLSCSQQ